jgi:predicted nucleic acid-binding protein
VSRLLDTCVVSELVRPGPQASVVSWVPERDEDELFLSVITMPKLRHICRLFAKELVL